MHNLQQLTAAILCLWSLSRLASADPYDPENIAPEIKAAANKAAEQTKVIPQNIQDKINHVMEVQSSPEFVSRRKQYVTDFLEGQGIEVDPKQLDEKPLDQTERLYLFISSSIPLETLRNYAADLEKDNGVMVVRGMIGGMEKAKPTLRWIQSIIKKDPGCAGAQCELRDVNVIIDPILFRDFSIHQVPAVAISKNYSYGMHCSDDKTVLQSSPFVSYGDANLQWHLRRSFEVTQDSRYLEYLKPFESQRGR